MRIGKFGLVLLGFLSMAIPVEAGRRKCCCCCSRPAAASAQAAAASPAGHAASAGAASLLGDVNPDLRDNPASGNPSGGGSTSITTLLGDVNPDLALGTTVVGQPPGTVTPQSGTGLLNESDTFSMETWRNLALYQAKVSHVLTDHFDLQKSSLSTASEVAKIPSADLTNTLSAIASDWK